MENLFLTLRNRFGFQVYSTVSSTSTIIVLLFSILEDVDLNIYQDVLVLWFVLFEIVMNLYNTFNSFVRNPTPLRSYFMKKIELVYLQISFLLPYGCYIDSYPLNKP